MCWNALPATSGQFQMLCLHLASGSDKTRDKAIFCTATKSVQTNCDTCNLELGDLTAISSGAVNSSTSPNNFGKDLHIIRKCCFHSRPENPTISHQFLLQIFINSFHVSWRGRGNCSAKYRCQWPACARLLPFRASSESELLPSCCLITSKRTNSSYCADETINLHLAWSIM